MQAQIACVLQEEEAAQEQRVVMNRDRRSGLRDGSKVSFAPTTRQKESEESSDKRSEPPPPLYANGDIVEAKWKAAEGGIVWYKGRVKSQKKTKGIYTYNIIYDDDDKEVVAENVSFP